MKLTLKQKRAIVRRFKRGSSILVVAWDVLKEVDFPSVVTIDCRRTTIEQVIRSYMRGEFQLAKRRGK